MSVNRPCPGPDLEEYWRYDRLIDSCAPVSPLRTAVIHPCDRDSLSGAIQAAQAHLLEPLLIGPVARIQSAAENAGLDLSPFKIIPAEHSHHAAEIGVAMALSGEADALMKGSLHTDEIMGQVVKKNGGLRTERRISHVFLMDIPDFCRPLLITDAAINIAPTLATKVDICQNAIDLAISMGISNPKVAILSAVETVNPEMQSTLDAAALSKMAERGQIVGGIIDGPLAYDNAVSVEAAKTKGIKSLVAGHADILVAPDLESGNMLAKQLTWQAHADGAGIVLGAKVPIILTSRSDNTRTRLASVAVATRVVDARRKGLLKKGHS
ncbi:MAG: bifunctional enoyl-CoA hydratase/phosphate acetyltransferase [Magnetococcales bacterium]|nr:bifunctional enoyl-CoA hydratase/phosphate acetyltransferase [Magnetococcales bacterium]MBF0150391.1 bifunctional enoyl-CoA hydratase/phosphate acetyltransferase [Magnetococcales bacterium]MBF0172105.1 bifunctional enoyl-CoA hydratase/phosphate acetyltransferase [Magnetococcales bacterium]MBF0347387.1 bifunctional enoyl-CoA hydratase/phosphate acetyltransferase [Magnetococcales bacterium]MBF0629879.1 bifunctional enoyl-CoA hydratase/phosphate acetyltransferase [Magnetococcales bacterium]